MAAEGDCSWIVVTNLPPGIDQRGSAWLEELGVKVSSLAYHGFGKDETQARWCAAECTGSAEAAAAAKKLSGRTVDTATLRAKAMRRKDIDRLDAGGVLDAGRDLEKKSTCRSSSEKDNGNQAENKKVHPGVAGVSSESMLKRPDGLIRSDAAAERTSSTGPPARAVPTEVMQLLATRAKKSSTSLGTASFDGNSSTGSGRGVASGVGSASAGSDRGTTGGHASSSSTSGQPRPGETAEQRAKRKAAEAALAAATGETPEQRAKRKAAEAAALARRAQREAEKKQQEKKSSGGDGGFGLYEGLPAPDPEKDAQAAKLAEAASKLNDVPKLIYKEDRTKIVFLDIDGVVRPLYGNQFMISSISLDGENVPIVDGDTEFIPTALSALRFILEQTGAALVLSSEWRRHPTLRDGVNTNLRKKGLPAVIDDTPTHERELTGNPLRSFAIRRAREIGAWLRAHPEVRQWVALDDIDLSQADEERQPGQPLLTPRLVLTDKTACLTKKDAQQAINILSGKLNKSKDTDEIPV